MHGLPAAREIVDAVLRLTEGKTGRVSAVNVDLGPDSTIDSEELELCFEVASKDTVLEGSKINIRLVPGEVKCLDCGKVERQVRVNRLPSCSSCLSINLKIDGVGIVLKDIEF